MQPSPPTPAPTSPVALQDPDDARIIAISLDDPERFGALFDRHHLAVFRYVRSCIGSSADDVVGDTFAEAFRTRSKFNEAAAGRSSLPWLLGIATNMLRRRRDLEQRWQRPDPTSPGESTDDEAAIDDRLAIEQLAPRLVNALANLRPDDREVLLLHVAGDLTTEELAQALAIPIGTVKSRMHRARRSLAEALEDHR